MSTNSQYVAKFYMNGHYIAAVKVCNIQFYSSLKQAIAIYHVHFPPTFCGCSAQRFCKFCESCKCHIRHPVISQQKHNCHYDHTAVLARIALGTINKIQNGKNALTL